MSEIDEIKKAEAEALELIRATRDQVKERLLQAQEKARELDRRRHEDGAVEQERILAEARQAAEAEANRMREEAEEQAEALRRKGEYACPRAVDHILARIVGG